MIPVPACQKKYSSAKVRFLKGALNHFFEREFPKLMGPILRDKLVDELISILQRICPEKDHLKPGQMLWNAVDIKTRPGSPNPKYIPVILTLINEDDTERLADGELMSKIRDDALARIHKESYEQGALLSARDIGLFSWRQGTSISKYRKNYEKEHDLILPHTGSLQDMGSCISHKMTIVKKVVLDKKDPVTVSNETNHTIQAKVY